MRNLAGKTMFISGASRGIGLAIALRAAQDGANVALMAKTAEPHPKLPGNGPHRRRRHRGRRRAGAADRRRRPRRRRRRGGRRRRVERFGGIDICVNNASAIDLRGIEALEMKRYDLMQDINARGTYAVSKACVPHLKRAENAHVLTLSPPISLEPKWLAPFTAYAIAKYGMTLVALGLAEELREHDVASNALWPRTPVDTAAIGLLGGDEMRRRSRTPAIYADSAYAVLTRESRECTGNALLCEDVLVEAGVTDLSSYSVAGPGADLATDFFVDDPNPPSLRAAGAPA
jgi:citronellol/citronellal dehydrogenase